MMPQPPVPLEVPIKVTNLLPLSKSPINRMTVELNPKLNSLFTVVKKVDAKKEARKVKQAQANSAPQTLGQDIKDTIDGFATVADVNAFLSSKSNDPLIAEINDYGFKIDELSVSNSFDQISNVVKVVEAEDIKEAGGAEISEDVFDGVLTFSEQANLDVVEAGKELGATKNLGIILAKPERASDFKKVTQTVSTDDVDASASLTSLKILRRLPML